MLYFPLLFKILIYVIDTSKETNNIKNIPRCHGFEEDHSWRYDIYNIILVKRASFGFKDYIYEESLAT
jgi:hypothetical protein